MQDQLANDNKPHGFKFAKRLQSFRFAARGIYRMVCSQHNAWIHAFATLVVVLAGVALNVSRGDWCWLVLCISLVWTAEAFNTAFECLANVASPDYHPLVRDAKDISAGAVLVAAIAAVIIGLIIFWPYVADVASIRADASSVSHEAPR